MMKSLTIAAALMLGTAAPALAQAQEAPPTATTGGSERVNLIIVYGDDPCPQSPNSNDIVVCARKGEEERYRIPEPLRGDPNIPSHQAWGERVRSMEYVGATGTESCSPVGGGGATGCFTKLARQAKAERQQADNANWKDLVEAERGRRLSTIDKDSEAIEARVKAQEAAEKQATTSPAKP